MVNFTLEAAPFWGVVFAAFTEGPAVGEEGWFLLELDIFIIFDSWSFQQGEGAQFLFRFCRMCVQERGKKSKGAYLICLACRVKYIKPAFVLPQEHKILKTYSQSLQDEERLGLILGSNRTFLVS